MFHAGVPPHAAAPHTVRHCIKHLSSHLRPLHVRTKLFLYLKQPHFYPVAFGINHSMCRAVDSHVRYFRQQSRSAKCHFLWPYLGQHRWSVRSGKHFEGPKWAFVCLSSMTRKISKRLAATEVDCITFREEISVLLQRPELWFTGSLTHAAAKENISHWKTVRRHR